MKHRQTKRKPVRDEPEGIPEGIPEGAFSILKLAQMTGRHRETIGKLVSGLQPAFEKGKIKYYRLADLHSRLDSKPGKDLKDQKLMEQIRDLKIHNDRAENKVLAKSVYIEAHQRILGPLRNLIYDTLENKLPQMMAGLDAPGARIQGAKLADTLVRGFQELLEQLPP